MWQHIQALKGGLPTGLGGSPPTTPLDPGSGYLTGGPGSGNLMEGNPADPMAGTPAGPMAPVGNPLATQPADPKDPATPMATKLGQYATALNALNKMTSNGPPPTQSSSFRASGGGGPGRGLERSPVGPSLPPAGPVTSAGTFLLSPAGRTAMARLQASMIGSVAA